MGLQRGRPAASRAPVQRMGADLRRLDVLVAEELLNRPDILAGFGSAAEEAYV